MYRKMYTFNYTQKQFRPFYTTICRIFAEHGGEFEIKGRRERTERQARADGFEIEVYQRLDHRGSSEICQLGGRSGSAKGKLRLLV